MERYVEVIEQTLSWTSYNILVSLNLKFNSTLVLLKPYHHL